MRMNAVLSNPKHPEYGQYTVPLPIPSDQYDGLIEALNAMGMGAVSYTHLTLPTNSLV